MHNEFAEGKLSDISIGLTIKVGMSSPSLSPLVHRDHVT